MRYWLGPWVWNVPAEGAPGWQSPDGILASLDLRSPTHCGLSGGTPQGVGLFVTANATDLGIDYRNLGTDPSLVLNSTQRSAWQTLLGLPNSLTTGVSVQEALYETITLQSDPIGERCLPLVPGSARRFEVWLGGQRIFNRAFDPNGIEIPALRDLLKRQYRALREQCQNGELPANLYLKVLGYWVRKYRLAYRWFQPDDLPDEADIPPTSILTDDYNRANQSGMGTAAAGWSWTVTAGAMDIANNQASSQAGSNGEAYAGLDLSSADHYAQVNVLTLSGAFAICGPLARKDASATRTYYTSGLNTGPDQQVLRKRVAGTGTVLRTDTPTLSLPDLVKVVCNGSTIEHFLNGVSTGSSTDTSIAGNLRPGVNGGFGINTMDDWEGGDLAAAALAGPLVGSGALVGGYLASGRLARS